MPSKKINKRISGWFVATANHVAWCVASKHDVLICDLLAGGRLKPRKIVAARAELVRELRGRLMYRDKWDSLGRRSYREYRENALAVSGDWKPLSTVDVARVLNADHSTIVLMLQRAVKEDNNGKIRQHRRERQANTTDAGRDSETEGDHQGRGSDSQPEPKV